MSFLLADERNYDDNDDDVSHPGPLWLLVSISDSGMGTLRPDCHCSGTFVLIMTLLFSLLICTLVLLLQLFHLHLLGTGTIHHLHSDSGGVEGGEVGEVGGGKR